MSISNSGFPPEFAGAKLDGYSIWVLWMLDAAIPQRIPKGITSVEAHWAAFGKANAALRADNALTDLISGQKYPAADGKVTFAGEKGQTYLFAG